MDVVVVGHGASPQGLGWGPQIDAADAVVRMFDSHWQDAADYGVRYDFGVATMSFQQLRWFSAEAIRKPEKWWFYRQDGNLITIRTERPQETFELPEDHDFALSLGAKTLGARFALTRGTAAACYAIRSLRPRRLILVGFDEVRHGVYGMNPYPLACLDVYKARTDLADIASLIAHRPTAQSRSMGHDLSVEMATIYNAATRCGVELQHADEVW